MRKFIAAAVTAVAFTLPVAQPAAAETLGTILFGRPSDPGVSIIYTSRQRTDDEHPASIYLYPSPERLAKAQHEIASSPALRDSLERRNIRLKNVLAVRTAYNGNKIVYVK